QCETGNHTIVPRGMHKPGSTLSKAERYEGFICELADYDSKVTFYQRQYPDGFAPEVLSLVPRAERADSINRALTEWTAPRRARWKLPRALTISDAVREILTALGEGHARWNQLEARLCPRALRSGLGKSVHSVASSRTPCAP